MFEYEMFNTKTNEVKFLFGRNLKVLMAKAEMNEIEWTCVYKEYIDWCILFCAAEFVKNLTKKNFF